MSKCSSSPSENMCCAIFRIVPYSFRSESLKLFPNACEISAPRRMAAMDVSPSLWSSAVTLTFLPDNTSLTRLLTFCSLSFSGTTISISSSETSGIFRRALRSTFPFGVTGSSSSCTQIDGIMYSARLSESIPRRASFSTGLSAL